ncbi:MAG: DUF393 domain-containing protein [bacterium]|nr:DUF393 domain-containing protein [bacterium]
MSGQDRETHVVFYDGVCGLCDRTVQLLLRIDRTRALSFAPLQGKAAAELKRRHRITRDLKTLLFVESYGTDRELVSSHSTGVLRILARLGGVWGAVSWLRIVPRPLRDLVYRTVARHRYHWFGRFDHCKLPDADLSDRFLD